MSIKVIQVNPIICPTPDIDTVNIISAARQERVCANMSPVTICVPQGVQGAQGPQGPQGIQGPAGPQGVPGQGVPTGGTAGQVLAKVDGTDYNTEWVDQSGGGLENPVNHIDFAAAPTEAIQSRRLQWNADAGTLDLGMDVPGVTQQIGQELFFRVKNQTGSAIADGTLVMAAGTTGNSGRILVAPSINDGSVPGHMLMGIVTHNLTNGADGFATHFGQVRGINTTGASVGETWADGDLLYPNPTQVGKLTNILPTGAGLKNPIAIVIHAHSNGSIFVRMSPGHEAQAVVTYAELIAKIGASTLIPGLQYLISDFRSSWYHLDGGAPINDPQYGSIEPIVVTAITANKIASLAFSTVHPSDVLYYDWNAANWTNDAFYSDGGTIIAGWRGVITRRIDTANNTNCTFNSRAMTFRRFALTAPSYNASTTYNRGAFVRFGARNNCFLCIQDGTVGVSPTSDYSKWCKILDGENIIARPFYLFNSAGHDFDFPIADDFWTFTLPAGSSSDLPAFPAGSKNISIEGPENYSAANVVLLTHSTGFSSSVVRDCTIGNSAASGIGPECSTIFARRLVNSTLPGYSEKIILGQVSAQFTGEILNVVLPNTGGTFGSMYRVAVSDTLSAVFVVSAQNSFFQKLSLSRIGDGCQFNTMNEVVNSQIGDSFSMNTALGTIVDTVIGNTCQLNLFTAEVSRAKIGNNFVSNQIFGEITSSSIADNASNNIVNTRIRFSSIGPGAVSNTLGLVDSCDFGAEFSGNTGDFIACNIGAAFSNNIFSSTVRSLTAAAGFSGTDFSSSTIVYGDYSKTFFKNANGDNRVQYIDASDNIVITNHDA